MTGMTRLSTKLALCTCLVVACGGKTSNDGGANGANGANGPGISDGTGPEATTPNDQVDPGAWNVALVTSLTGPDAALGQSLLDGAALAVEQINALGGVKGKPVKLVVKDDASSPEASRAAVLDLAQKGVHIGVGPATSRAAAAWIDLVRARQLVYVSPSATSRTLDPPDVAQRDPLAPMNDLLFRTQLRATQLGVAAAQWLSETRRDAQQRRCPSLAVVHLADDEPSASIAAYVEQRYELLSLRTLDVRVASGTELRAAAAQVIGASPPLACQLVTLPATMAGAYASAFASVRSSAPPDFVSAAAGPETTTPAFFAATTPTDASGWNLVRPNLVPSPELDAFTNVWALRHPVQPKPDFVHAAAFDAAMLAIAGLVRSGTPNDTAQMSAALVAFSKGGEVLRSSKLGDVVRAMEDDGDVDYSGASGSVDIAPSGYVPNDAAVTAVDDAGRLVPVATYLASTIGYDD